MDERQKNPPKVTVVGDVKRALLGSSPPTTAALKKFAEQLETSDFEKFNVPVARWAGTEPFTKHREQMDALARSSARKREAEEATIEFRDLARALVDGQIAAEKRQVRTDRWLLILTAATVLLGVLVVLLDLF
jgi:hypothetical protein